MGKQKKLPRRTWKVKARSKNPVSFYRDDQRIEGKHIKLKFKKTSDDRIKDSDFTLKIQFPSEMLLSDVMDCFKRGIEFENKRVAGYATVIGDDACVLRIDLTKFVPIDEQLDPKNVLNN